MIQRADSRRSAQRGFTLVEMIVVTLLLLIAMLGLLAVFDASARINKSETDVADAQGAVRYGIYQMTRVIRMAGAGGLYVTQAVLNAKDSEMPGITVGGGGTSYNNVPTGTSVTDSTGTNVLVRPGTDMIQIRGVIMSPLLGFAQQPGCSAGCTTNADAITIRPVAGNAWIGSLVNDDVQRPQFAAIDAYTASITSAANSMFVIVTDGFRDLHVGCSDTDPQGVQRWPQPLYHVGTLTSPTDLSTNTDPAPRNFGTANFTTTKDLALNAELPSGPQLATLDPVDNFRRIGILDDIVFFIAMLPTCSPAGPGCDPLGQHPYLAQGIRRGDRFEVTPLADDVEDLQIAYGVDADGDDAVTRSTAANPPFDPDPNFSTVPGSDEWQPNTQPVASEAPFTDIQFQSDPTLVDNHPGAPPAGHCPRLRGVMVSLLAKARNPDPTYSGPGASGYVLMDVGLAAGVPVTAVQGKYRRRVQTLRINLRNYYFQG